MRRKARIKRQVAAATTRVEQWNSLQILARRAAEEVYEGISHVRVKRFEPFGGARGAGLRLSDEQIAVLRLLALSCISIESRANHLIEEKLPDASSSEYKTAMSRSTWDKWRLLPELNGNSRLPDTKDPPHGSVRAILDFRHSIMHHDPDRLRDRLPSASEAIELFKGWVDALLDMHRLLGRMTQEEEVRKWAKFEPDQVTAPSSTTGPSSVC